jgi:hypothetical protein
MAVLRDSDLRHLLDRVTADRSGSPPPAAGGNAARPVIQRISSRKPIEVMLSPLAAGAALPGIAGLHALDPNMPSIRQVGFSPRPDGALELRIDVPDDQPEGVYTGAVIDPDSLQALGTLTVRVVA